MATDVISFSSGLQQPLVDKIPFSKTTKGLRCDWTSDTVEGKNHSIWTFNWEELKSQRVCGFSGELVFKGSHRYDSSIKFTPKKLEVDLTDQNKVLRTEISTEVFNNYAVEFTYTLIPIISMTEVYDEMFLSSDKNDAVLKVDGFQLNVSKAFLSYHSEYFAALFSSNFKEGQMDVIPIKDVTYEEIGLLFSTIYPKTVFPNDKTVPKLLELADRFMMPSVIHHVEYHLLNNTKIDNEKMMWMADRYGMELLLEKMIKELDSVAKAKKLKASSDYKDLSDKTKGKILDKVMMII